MPNQRISRCHGSTEPRFSRSPEPRGSAGSEAPWRDRSFSIWVGLPSGSQIQPVSESGAPPQQGISAPDEPRALRWDWSSAVLIRTGWTMGASVRGLSLRGSATSRQGSSTRPRGGRPDLCRRLAPGTGSCTDRYSFQFKNNCRNVKRFRGGLVFKAHRLLYHSTLGVRVIKKKKNPTPCVVVRRPKLHGVTSLRLNDSCITQLKAQGPSRTCNESKEEEEEE